MRDTPRYLAASGMDSSRSVIFSRPFVIAVSLPLA
jgi:hypothetical protein